MGGSKNIEVMSFSLPRELVKRLDALSRRVGYTARSELIRDGVRLLMKHHERLDGLRGMSEGVVIVLYDHAADRRVSDLRHRFTDVVRSYTHCDFDLNSRRCCEIMIFRGEAGRVRRMVEGLQSLKRVDELQLFLA